MLVARQWLLDWIGADTGLTLQGEGVKLRPPRWSDYAEWSLLRARSRVFLQPWEPTWPKDDLSKAAFRRRLSAYQRDAPLSVLRAARAGFRSVTRGNWR